MGMANPPQSVQTSLIFGFLVAFLGLFAVGVSVGIVWPLLVRNVRRLLGLPELPEPQTGIRERGRQETEVPRLWDVVARDAGTGGGGGSEPDLGRGKGKGLDLQKPSTSANRRAWDRLHVSILSPSCPDYPPGPIIRKLICRLRSRSRSPSSPPHPPMTPSRRNTCRRACGCHGRCGGAPLSPDVLLRFRFG